MTETHQTQTEKKEKLDPVQRKRLEAAGYHAPSQCPLRGTDEKCEFCLSPLETETPTLDPHERADQLLTAIRKTILDLDPDHEFYGLITLTSSSDDHPGQDLTIEASVCLDKDRHIQTLRRALSHDRDVLTRFIWDTFTGEDPVFTFKVLALLPDCTAQTFTEMSVHDPTVPTTEVMAQVTETLARLFSSASPDYALIHLDAIRGIHVAMEGEISPDAKADFEKSKAELDQLREGWEIKNQVGGKKGKKTSNVPLYG